MVTEKAEQSLGRDPMGRCARNRMGNEGTEWGMGACMGKSLSAGIRGVHETPCYCTGLPKTPAAILWIPVVALGLCSGSNGDFPHQPSQSWTLSPRLSCLR